MIIDEGQPLSSVFRVRYNLRLSRLPFAKFFAQRGVLVPRQCLDGKEDTRARLCHA